MDWNVILNFVLGVLTLLLGGWNIHQMLTFKSYKRQQAAVADKAELENLKTVIETIQSSMQIEIDRLQARVEKAEARADKAEERAEKAEQRASENASKYLSLFEKHDALRTEFEQYKSNHK